MPPLINFKICDNSADCNGIPTCPTGVFYFDEIEKTLKTDLSKCIECAACADCCSVNAIRYAKDEEEFAQIQKEIDEDPRKISDLFCDRYGSDTVIDTYTFELSPEKLANRINSNRPVIIEFNTPSTIECLLKSIPIQFIQDQFHKDATYSKFFVDENDFAKYEITKTPCLRFYNKGKLLGSVDGFYENDDKFDLFEIINSINKKI